MKSCNRNLLLLLLIVFSMLSAQCFAAPAAANLAEPEAFPVGLVWLLLASMVVGFVYTLTSSAEALELRKVQSQGLSRK